MAKQDRPRILRRYTQPDQRNDNAKKCDHNCHCQNLRKGRRFAKFTCVGIDIAVDSCRSAWGADCVHGGGSPEIHHRIAPADRDHEQRAFIMTRYHDEGAKEYGIGKIHGHPD